MFPPAISRTHIENMRTSDRIPLQHPGNFIDYSHPVVHKVIRDNKEVYFAFPNDGLQHATLYSTYKWKSVKILPHPSEGAPLPACKRAALTPYLWKEEHFRKTHFRERRTYITHRLNKVDYFSNEVKMDYKGEFYKIQVGFQEITLSALPNPKDPENPTHKAVFHTYPIATLITNEDSRTCRARCLNLCVT